MNGSAGSRHQREDRGVGNSYRRGDAYVDDGRGENEAGVDYSGDRRMVVREDAGDGSSTQRKQRHGGNNRGWDNKKSKGAEQVREDVGFHESQVTIQRNLMRSPVYGDFVPIFSPPPPFPGYAGRVGYVPAAAAGSAGGLARDARHDDGRGYRRGDRRSPAEERARSRGCSVSRWQADDRARSRGQSAGPLVESQLLSSIFTFCERHLIWPFSFRTS